LFQHNRGIDGCRAARWPPDRSDANPAGRESDESAAAGAERRPDRHLALTVFDDLSDGGVDPESGEQQRADRDPARTAVRPTLRNQSIGIRVRKASRKTNINREEREGREEGFQRAL